MFVLHIALQGCLRASGVEYGVTADTGGHIRYLLDLVTASGVHPAFDRMEIVTRAFRFPGDEACYAQPFETVDERTRIVRLRSDSPDYRAKEALWAEHDSLIAALADHIRSLDRRPDVIHAHYADAGAIAAAMRDLFGISYVFTAHSLGRVKRAAFGHDCAETAGLDRRIAIEERAIAGAAAIIASSRDEAEGQYALYDAYDPGRIRVIAPGSDLSAFACARTEPSVSTSVDRFLADPGKPAILAIARPVTKKNLSALVHAYGRSPALQAKANLVLIAGTRDDLRTLEPEIGGNLAELLALIDRYDLYGRVAYPKSHRAADVPAIYAHVRCTRGLFVNPALNEPFGLTLLEAAASGLPVVATDSGGPNDIVSICGHGVLVNPRDADGIAQAVLAILEDEARYDRYAAAGPAAVGAFDWASHVAAYADLLHAVIERDARVSPARPTALLVSDIDGTLLGCGDALAEFGEWHRRARDTVFAVATGRSFHSALAILMQHGAPMPEIVIASVGSEIYHRQRDGSYARDEEWARTISAGWDRERVAALVERQGGLVPQAPLEQRAFKLSYFVSDGTSAAHRLRDLLDRADLTSTVIESHGRYLDILPYAASKGTAVEHVRRRLGIDPGRVVVAGDSGNDVEMLRSVPNAIIVANHSDGIAARPDLAGCYVARGRHAAGIMEGLAHFRTIAS